MSQARLTTCLPLPMENKLLVTVIEKAKDWALMHGVGMRDKKNFTKDSIQVSEFFSQWLFTYTTTVSFIEGTRF